MPIYGVYVIVGGAKPTAEEIAAAEQLLKTRCDANGIVEYHPKLIEAWDVVGSRVVWRVEAHPNHFTGSKRTQ